MRREVSWTTIYNNIFSMPRYKRKNTTLRVAQTEEQLRNGIDDVENEAMGLNEAAETFGSPKAILIRRKQSGNLQKEAGLEPSCSLGDESYMKAA